MNPKVLYPKEADKYQDYYDYLCSFLIPDWKFKDDFMTESHEILLKTLLEKEFYYLNPLDENRAIEGVTFREIFRSHGRNGPVPEGPCRILEMLVAFADKIEFQIMENDAYGDRTSVWFWDMLENLGVIFIDNDHYSAAARSFLDIQVDKWLSGRDPKVCIFPREDLSMDLWMCANLYLNENYPE